MPKISELPTDVAPDVLDTVPFVDVSAARTEQVTVGDLAASAAFSGRYQQLAGDEIWLPAGSFSVILGSPVPGVGAPFVDAYLMDASGDEIVASSVFLPAWWATFAVDLYW